MWVSSWLDGTSGQSSGSNDEVVKEARDAPGSGKTREITFYTLHSPVSPLIGEPFCGSCKLRTAASSLPMGQKGGGAGWGAS